MSNAQASTVVNPVPVVTSLSQQNTLIDSPAFPLQIAGSGFVPQGTVMFGSTVLTPSSVTPTLLTVLVSQAAITTAGTGPTFIRVVNPTPGGGTSNSERFTIQNPEPALATISPPSITADVSEAVLTISGSHSVQGVRVTVGTKILTSLPVQPQTLTVAIPAAQLIPGSSIVVSVENPARYDATVPVNQEVFVYDLTTEKLTAVAKARLNSMTLSTGSSPDGLPGSAAVPGTKFLNRLAGALPCSSRFPDAVEPRTRLRSKLGQVLSTESIWLKDPIRCQFKRSLTPPCRERTSIRRRLPAQRLPPLAWSARVFAAIGS